MFSSLVSNPGHVSVKMNYTDMSELAGSVGSYKVVNQFTAFVRLLY